MSTSINQQVRPHVFMPGQTVSAIIKLVNRHDVTSSELESLIAQFNDINGNNIFKAGERALVPVLSRHQDVSRK